MTHVVPGFRNARTAVLNVHTLLAIGCATIAAITLGIASRFQHGAVKEGANGGRLALKEFLGLLRNRTWLLGTALVLCGVLLHVVALGLAPLAIVQPIGILSLVTIVLVGDGHHKANGGTWLAVAATCVGTAGFVLLASQATGHTQGTLLPVTAQFVVLGVLVCVGIAAISPQTVRCIGFAICSAALFGLTSAFMRSVLQDFFVHGISWRLVFVALEAGALALLGGWLVQQAYAAGPAAVVLGTITVGDPFTAVIIGMTLYGEAANLTAMTAAGEIACALIAVVGVVALARQVPRTALVQAGE